jgi:hypothetical protein
MHLYGVTHADIFVFDLQFVVFSASYWTQLTQRIKNHVFTAMVAQMSHLSEL